MLLAFSAKKEELDILMLSLTFGNVEVKKYVCCSCVCSSLYSTWPLLIVSFRRVDYSQENERDVLIVWIKLSTERSHAFPLHW